MKKFISACLLAVIALNSCQRAAGVDTAASTAPAAGKLFNPPTWIQGTWAESDKVPYEYIFTADDFMEKISNNAVSHKNLLSIGIQAGLEDYHVKETTTADTYTMVITTGPLIKTYSFKKISNTRIEMVEGQMVSSGSKRYFDKK